MVQVDLPQVAVYRRHYSLTIDWLLRSIRKPRGGSAAYFSPVTGWSRPYPETTGYLIPTLLDAAERLDLPSARAAALECGEWLLSIQREDGAWSAGVHPPGKDDRPSVFNTGQILVGMLALQRATGEPRWLAAAHRGARWMAQRVDASGRWEGGDYRGATMMSYYAHAAWPMTEVGLAASDAAVRDAGERVLLAIASRRTADGSFAEWGFEEGRPAFTHTIAYTLWGLQAGATALGRWDDIGLPTIDALDRLARAAERAGGALPGAYATGWKEIGGYVCLTGNAQIALCLLAAERGRPELRWVNAACKLVDFVCSSQSTGPMAGPLRGAVAGSKPLWGRYMTLRYPNWAAKYHADALAALIDRLSVERN